MEKDLKRIEEAKKRIEENKEVIIDSNAAKGISQPIIVHSKNKTKSDKTTAA